MSRMNHRLDPYVLNNDPVAAAYRNSLRNDNERGGGPGEDAERRIKELQSQLRLSKKKEHDANAQNKSLRQQFVELEKDHDCACNELFEATEMCVQLKSALSQYRKRTQELENALKERGQLPQGLAMSPDMRRLVAVEKELSSTKKQHMQLLHKHEESMQHNSQSPPRVKHQTPPKEKSPSPKPSSPPVQGGQRIENHDDDLMAGDALLGIVRRGRLESMEQMLHTKNDSIVTLQEQNATLKSGYETEKRECEGAKARARLYENHNKQLRKEADDAIHKVTLLERESQRSDEAVKLVPQLKLKLQLLEGELINRSKDAPTGSEDPQDEESLQKEKEEGASAALVASQHLDLYQLAVEESEERTSVVNAESLGSAAVWEEKSNLALKLFGLDRTLMSQQSFADI